MTSTPATGSRSAPCAHGCSFVQATLDVLLRYSSSCTPSCTRTHEPSAMTDMPWLVAAFTALSLDAPGWNQICLMPNAAASSTTASATFGGVMTEIQHTPSGSDLMDATAANPSTTSEVGFTGTAVYLCCGPEHGVSYWSCMRCNTARPTFMYARNTCCSANEGEPRHCSATMACHTIPCCQISLG